MVAQALMPFAIGRAIQDGIVDDDSARARALGARPARRSGSSQAFAGVMRHRFAVQNWLQASFRLAQVVAPPRGALRARRARRGSRPARSSRRSRTTRCAPAARSTSPRASRARSSSYVVVAVILLSVVGRARARRPARRAGARARCSGRDPAAPGAPARAARGGREADRARRRHGRRAARAARDRRRAGVLRPLPPPLAAGAAGGRARRAAAVDARRGAGARCPGIFVVLVTWLGARFALSGQIDVGDLVAFYGYAAFLVIPLRTAAEAVDKVTRALVGARRMLDVLDGRARTSPSPATPAAEPPAGVPLADDALGARRRAGPPHVPRLVAARRGGGARRPARPLRRRRRRHARRTSASPTCRSTPSGGGSSSARPIRCSSRATLRSELDPWARADDDDDPRGVSVANAEDVLDALPEGLDARSTSAAARSRAGSASGSCSRARCSRDAELLVLVEPTSAVDAHTEARIARRLREARAGTDDRRRRRRARSCSTRPTASCCVEDGRVVAVGTHRELLRTSADYRDTVTRGRGLMSDAAARSRTGPSCARRRGCSPAGTARALAGVVALHAARRGRRPRRAGAARRARPVGRGRDDDVRYVDRLVLVLAGFLARADDPHVVSRGAPRSSSPSRCSPSCARTSCAACSRCRSRPSSAPGTGDLVSRTTADVDSLARTIRFAVPETLIAAVTTVLTVAAAVWVSPLAALPLPRRRAGALGRHALVPAPRAGGLPLGARRLRDARRHGRRDGRRRPHDRGARPARGARAADRRRPRGGLPRRAAHAATCARSGSRPPSSPTCSPSRPRSRGAAGSSPPATPRSAR